MIRPLTIAALIVLLAPYAQGSDHTLPDPKLTPGAIDPRVTQGNIASTICRPGGYTKSVRHTSAALKASIYAEYKVDKKKVHAEVDHRIPLTAGGADVKANLWVQDYDSHPFNAHLKDKLEVFIGHAICRRTMTLKQGQAIFLGDWTASYVRYFGRPE